MKLKHLLTLTLLMAASAHADRGVLNGKYSIKATFGDQVFMDEMVLKGVDQVIDKYFFDGRIEGSLTVPDIFSSPLIGSAKCFPFGSFCNLKFVIIAFEKGRYYNVFYNAQLTVENYFKEPLVLTGTVSVEDGKTLGTFEATLVQEEK